MVTCTVTLKEFRGANQIYVEYRASGPWGDADLTLTADVTNVSVAQAITALKNSVIAFAATNQGGNLVLQARDVWVFNGPQ